MHTFDGETYDPTQDKARLSSQLERVKALMLDGEWRTLGDIASRVYGSEAGVSARLRDLRKTRFGGYDIHRERMAGGVWVYRMTERPMEQGELWT